MTELCAVSGALLPYGLRAPEEDGHRVLAAGLQSRQKHSGSMKLPAADCLLHSQCQPGKVDGAQHFAGGPETQGSVHGLVPIINPDGVSQPAVSSGPHLRVGPDKSCVRHRVCDVVAQRRLDRPGYEGWFPGLRISHVAFLQSLRDVLARLNCVGRQIRFFDPTLLQPRGTEIVTSTTPNFTSRSGLTHVSPI